MGWSYISFIRKGTILQSFKDSVLVSEINTRTHFNIVNNAPILFGNGPCVSADGTRSLVGMLDEVRFYNRAISASEIKTLYQSKQSETSCTTSESGTVASNLDIHMPSLKYQTLLGVQNIWADLEYKGTNSAGQHIWGLKDFGVNQ